MKRLLLTILPVLAIWSNLFGAARVDTCRITIDANDFRMIGSTFANNTPTLVVGGSSGETCRAGGCWYTPASLKAYIDSAFIVVLAGSAESGNPTISLKVKAYAAANPDPIGSSSDWNSRFNDPTNYFSDSVMWSVSSSDPWTQDTRYKSADIGRLIQSVRDQASFTNGYRTVLSIDNAGGTANFRYVRAREYGTADGMWLLIYSNDDPPAPCPDTLIAPALGTPADGATGVNNVVTLDWNAPTGVGTADYYDVEVDNNSDFSSPAVRDTTSATQYTCPTLNDGNTYYWRVRGRSECNVGAYDTASFTMSGDFATGVNYYVRPGGSWENDGTSWSTAWSHPNRVNYVAGNGFTLWIGKGTYDTTLILPARGGDDPTIYRCSSIVARADIELEAGITTAATWTLHSGNIWKKRIVPITASIASTMTNYNLTNITLTQNDSLVTPRATLGEVVSPGQMYYNNSTDTCYVWAYGSVNPNVVTMRHASHPVVRFSWGDQDFITFYGLTMQCGDQHIVVLTDSEAAGDAPDNITISHCVLRGSSQIPSLNNAALIYSGNPSGGGPSDVDYWGRFNRVVACSLDWCSSVNDDLNHRGMGVTVYAQRNLIIDSCDFGTHLQGGGIALKLGSLADYGINADSIFILHNTIRSGREYGLWIGNKTKNVRVAGNIFYDCFRAIDMHSSGDGTDPMEGNITIMNNTFFDNDNDITVSAAHNGCCNRIAYNVFGRTATPSEVLVGFYHIGGEAPEGSPSTNTYWEPANSGQLDSNLYDLAGTTFIGYVPANSGYTGAYVNLNSHGYQLNWLQWLAEGYDIRSTNNVGAEFYDTTLILTNPLLALARPDAVEEMGPSGIAHSGRTWYVYGAPQNDATIACDTPTPLPVISAPIDASDTNRATVIVDWSASNFANAYEINVSTAVNWSTLVFADTVTPSIDTVTGLLDNTTYYVRVRAFNYCDTDTSVSGWSGVITFETSPTMMVTSVDSLNFVSGLSGSPANQFFLVSSYTGNAMEIDTLYEGADWLTATPIEGGAAPLTVTCAINTSGMDVGYYSGNVTIVDAGSTNTPKTVKIALRIVDPPPSLTVNSMGGTRKSIYINSTTAVVPPPED